MRSEGNRNLVILSRMIKARFSSFVCPVAPYVSYFSFTSCQWFVVFFCMLPNVKYKRSAGLEALHFQFILMFVNIQLV
ncbi:MAG: hypothetical protein HLUCCX10_14945 [Algoriphagus marincola HL-49]|uniref:Uncharacterized protein n=1 Tax=Algoriphagus marincola HL-49 TaxID=1305737 RepID=A0A0P7Y500_9BACT|nr:MAG: hypothetical protein HLUCCX10_14945 [Algoriphagus marincola HL-49]